jgi:hypothetical protein
MTGVVLLLVPAGRAAWRAGVRGHRLGVGFSGAAWICFVCGALALVATRGHRVDREQTMVMCEQDRLLMPWNNRQTDLANSSPSELVARRVEACEPARWTEFVGAVDPDTVVVWGYELFADGRVSTLTMARGWSRADHELFDAVEADAIERLHDDLAGERSALLLYFDERSSMASIDRLLTIARRVGIKEVILVGEAFVDQEFVTLGA